MDSTTIHSGLAPRLVDALYAEALLLADEARAYFDRGGAAERDRLPARLRVAISCEALKITTRLMHLVAWLLSRRAAEAGARLAGERADTAMRLGHAEDSDHGSYEALPLTARALIDASRELYDRVRRLDDELHRAEVVPGPARNLLDRLERAF
jgi:regulator of CtrA degradation